MATSVCNPTLSKSTPLTPFEPTPVEDAVWTATGHERPIFLDEHGRRRRWVLIGGALSGGASAMWLGALVAGAIGFSSMPAVNVQTQPLLASRPAPVRSPSTVRHHRVTQRHFSGLGGPTELAVSRALLSER